MIGKRITWVTEMDAMIRGLRAIGKPWDEVAERVGVSKEAVRARAIALGMFTGPLSSGTMTGERVMRGEKPVDRRAVTVSISRPNGSKWGRGVRLRQWREHGIQI